MKYSSRRIAFPGTLFRWLIEEGASYDLICIAGDLLDMFYSEPRIVHARKVSRWIRELAKVTRVAIRSGNHDNVGRQILADRARAYELGFKALDFVCQAMRKSVSISS
jgi:UDP-2,3-diacylglucosamine pyrophosphatase LpxH